MSFNFKHQWARYLPILRVWHEYNREKAVGDATAAMIVTLMLVPQALAYAMLSGLPPQVGLYASMLPLILYAVFGTSATLAVGPVAVAALMTASAIAPFSTISTEMGVQAAVVMALISGIFLLVAGVLRLGFLANFLSHPVIAGFISAASIVIATSQLPTLLGFSVSGDNMPQLVTAMLSQINKAHGMTSLLSCITIGVLWCGRKYASQLLQQLGLRAFVAQTLARAIPAILLVLGVWAVRIDVAWMADIKTVGEVVGGFPSIGLPTFSENMWRALIMPAMLISIVGYVESISVAQSMAIKRRERVQPDQELIALGLSNLAAGVSAGLPVTGGVSRSVVNVDAGAKTQLAGLMTGIGMIAATYFLATWLSDLPRFILAATIIVAVLSLFDLNVFKHTWQLSKRDFVALMITFLTTLLVNVEWGISAGVLLSIGLHLYKSSHPHIAVVGQVRGTEHFRNIERFDVNVCPDVVTIRIDESLFFANARFLEQRIHEIVAENPTLKHLVLMCSAVNDIDGSALEVLENVNDHLKRLGIGFHFSEVKGPVMDNLKRSHLLDLLNGNIYLTQFKAYEELSCLNR
jgi:SulP family sulfate permease